jgi:DNA-binding SARP family transcriptional activator
MGPPRVTVDGAALEVDTRKAVALLAYLTLESGRQPRDRIVDLLWTDSDVDRARSSLRRTLSTLRSGLGGRWVGADRSFIWLETDGIDVDTDRLEALLAPHDQHPSGEVCAACITDLTAAVDLHRGPFMDGFVIRGAPAFELWATTHAERVAQRIDTALTRLTLAHAASGDYDAAADAAERRLELDPLREQAYRDLMLHRAWSGDRSGAVDVYRRAVAVLDQELGVPPLEETTELYQAVLEEDLPRAPAPPRPERVISRPSQAPLVGRDDEVDAALAALESAGAVVMVEGEPGVGISRFLEEVTGRLNERTTALVTAGTESNQGTPYGVLNQALFGITEDEGMRAALDRLPDPVLAEASRILPGLGTPPAESNPTRFMDALTRLVAAVPDPLLVIDDVHQCDAASLAVFEFMMERAARIGLRLLAGTAMTGSTSTSSPDLTALRRRAHHIRLQPLDIAAIAEFTVVTGIEASPARLQSETGGLPLFLVEATRHRGEGAGHLADRLDALDGTERQVYEAMAVLGGASDPVVVASVSGRTRDETDEAIDQLIGLGMVVEDQAGFVACAHGLLATTANDQITAARRRLLHRRAAQVLQDRGAAEPALIARHHGLAGDDGAAAEWHLLAGEAAAAAFAHHEAIEHLEAALAAGHGDRARIHHQIGSSALLAGKYERAVEEFETALAVGDPEAARVEHRLGEIMRRLQRWDLAAAHYEEAATHDPDEELAAIIQADRAYVELRRSGSEAAQPIVEQSLEMAEAAGSRRALARSRNVAGLVATTPTARRAHFEAALEAALDPAERIAVLNNLARQSEGDEAVDLANEGLAMATTLGDRHLMAALGNTLADALHATGDTAASHAALAAAVELFATVSTDHEGGWSPEVWFLTEW